MEELSPTQIATIAATSVFFGVFIVAAVNGLTHYMLNRKTSDLERLEHLERLIYATRCPHCGGDLSER